MFTLQAEVKFLHDNAFLGFCNTMKTLYDVDLEFMKCCSFSPVTWMIDCEISGSLKLVSKEYINFPVRTRDPLSSQLSLIASFYSIQNPDQSASFFYGILVEQFPKLEVGNVFFDYSALIGDQNIALPVVKEPEVIPLRSTYFNDSFASFARMSLSNPFESLNTSVFKPEALSDVSRVQYPIFNYGGYNIFYPVPPDHGARNYVSCVSEIPQHHHHISLDFSFVATALQAFRCVLTVNYQKSIKVFMYDGSNKQDAKNGASRLFYEHYKYNAKDYFPVSY